MQEEYCTTWDLAQEYGISKNTTSKAAREGTIQAIKKKTVDKYGEELTINRWFIVKNENLEKFIEENRKK